MPDRDDAVDLLGMNIDENPRQWNRQMRDIQNSGVNNTYRDKQHNASTRPTNGEDTTQIRGGGPDSR